MKANLNGRLLLTVWPRALLDIWYRRHPEFAENSVKEALLLLAGQPRMAVPPTTNMAVKLYLDQNKKDSDNSQFSTPSYAWRKAAVYSSNCRIPRQLPL